MSESRKRLLVDLGGGLIGAFAVAWLKGIFVAESATGVFSALCDGFFVAAVLLLGLGALGYVRNTGVFDAGFFSLKKVFQLKWQGLGNWREEYHEYLANKKTKRSTPKPQLIAGAIYMGLSLVCLVLYLAL